MKIPRFLDHLWIALPAMLLAALPAWSASAPDVTLADHLGGKDFPLVVAHTAAGIRVDDGDFKVVHIAADCLAADIAAVTGAKPAIASGLTGLSSQPVVLIGTIGHSQPIDQLIRAGKLDVANITGKWESYVIATVTDPLPGIHRALVIAGSDRRGTAYGVFDLSEAIGVSPWVWWEDVTPRHRDSLVITAGRYAHGPPSVKYRGIFINDEDWSIQPWAAQTFEPDTKDIGPKTYAKVCELLLRLKANYLWPAMHPCTKAFNIYPRNKIVADDYAIVMGSSHAEPMLRDNVTEWDKSRGPWDYDKNRDGILKYWEERVQQNASYENVYTIGMRGIHDSAMPGGGSMADKVARLQRVIDDQRAMLARDINPKLDQVPQIFVPYKEVLILYQNGLQVPPDVTLVWPDDNHGYIRELSTPEEQKRPGGSGIYYHVSYWGAPNDYLWLCTTPPSLIWEEMRKAYDNGARTVWVLNVGGLKKSAIDMDFFLRMAWDIDGFNQNAQPAFLADWAGRTFGADNATAIAWILNQYFQLNYTPKPEHLLQAGVAGNDFAKQMRLKQFANLVASTNAIYNKMPPEQKDAFYELVVYQVRCSALLNEKILDSNSAEAQKAYDQIQAETKYYNEQLAGGKWNHMMSADPHNQPVFQKPIPAPQPSPSGTEPAVTGIGHINFAARDSDSIIRPGNSTWTVIPGLGRSGGSVALLPPTAIGSGSAELDYNFYVPNAGPATVNVYCIPTHSLYPGTSLRYSVAIDQEPPQIIDMDTKEFSHQWSVNVLRAAAIGTTIHTLSLGAHTLKLHPLDPGVVFDKIVIDLGGLQPSQLGPPENGPPHFSG